MQQQSLNSHSSPSWLSRLWTEGKNRQTPDQGKNSGNQSLIGSEKEQLSFLAQLATIKVYNKETLDNLCYQAVKGVRELIKTDRVLIYQFFNTEAGKVTYESVSTLWPSALVTQAISQRDLLSAQPLEETQIHPLASANLSPLYRQWLERLQVQANLVIPIYQMGEAWGLLMVHQCVSEIGWDESSVIFARQVVNQLEISLERWQAQENRHRNAKLSSVLKEITLEMSRISDQTALLELVVNKSRQGLGSDRTIVYCFDSSWRGTIIAESVDPVFPTALGSQIKDPCFAEKYVDKYRQGRVKATNDIYQAELTECHLNQLSPFEVKANLVTPILVKGELFGLLIAHYCGQTHVWQPTEIDFLSQIALQLGVALEQVNLLEQHTLMLEEIRQGKEALQKRALDLLREVEPVSQGDFRIQCSEQEDEIGKIARSYNRLIENIRQWIKEMQTTSHQVATMTQGHEMGLETLSLNAIRQIDCLSQSLMVVNQIQSSVQNITLNAQEALKVTEETRQVIITGEKEIEDTMTGMHNIRETVSETMSKIEHLGESSQKISKVVNLISRFAAQTHLLALKASIEAARAGEEGRGFAVIADEVRSLAAQSAEATAEIETLVASIQAETKEVATTMQSGTQQVWLGSQRVETVRNRMRDLVGASTQIQEWVAGITLTTANQSQESESVGQMIAEVTELAENTAQLSTTLGESLKELLDLSNKLQETSVIYQI